MAQPAPAAVHLTVQEFLTYDTPEGKAELVRGELRVIPPPGSRHAMIAMELGARIHAHVRARALGRVFSNGSFELLALPRTVRAPDIAFVAAARLPAEGIGPGLLRMPPDLAIEILSPSETATRLQEKLDDYRAAGVPLVWVIDPERRTVMVVAADAALCWVREDGTLDGSVVVPGFSFRVGDIFEGIA